MEIPDQETVLRELSDVFPVVKSSYDYATYKVIDFFAHQDTEEQRVLNRYLAPNLVRFYALQALKNDRENRFDVECVPNNGLCLVKANYKIRILKSCNGQLPVPGHSIARRRFYSQQKQLSFYFLEPLPTNADKLNLIILWEVKPPYNIGRLSLACPKSGELTRDSVTAYWHCAIPDSLLRSHSDEVNQAPLEIEDLPLTFSLDDESSREAL